jgi:hypothetical protein
MILRGLQNSARGCFPNETTGALNQIFCRRRGVAVHQSLISFEIFLERAQPIQADNRSPSQNQGGASQTAFRRPQKEAAGAAWRRSPPQVCAVTALAEPVLDINSGSQAVVSRLPTNWLGAWPGSGVGRRFFVPNPAECWLSVPFEYVIVLSQPPR